MSKMSTYRKARMIKCLKQKEAAEFLGISATYLCLIENLSLKPTQELLLKMAKLYEVNIRELQ